jgi:hypothetical protein
MAVRPTGIGNWSGEGTAKESPVSGRWTVETDYIRLLNPFKWCPHQTEGIEIFQRYQAKVFEKRMM